MNNVTPSDSPDRYTNEMDYLIAMAQKGDPDAQFELGYHGITKNFGASAEFIESLKSESVESIKWLRRSADQGNVHAQFHLGLSYAKGWGVAADVLEAKAWHLKAAENGNSDAQHHLACMLWPAADVQDEVEVANRKVEAVSWLKKAACRDHAAAKSFLATCYANGEGVEQNEYIAIRYFKEALDDAAIFYLGKFYLEGEKVAKDEIEAYACFNLVVGRPADEFMAIWSYGYAKAARSERAKLEEKLTCEARLRGQQRTKELLAELVLKHKDKLKRKPGDFDSYAVRNAWRKAQDALKEEREKKLAEDELQKWKDEIAKKTTPEPVAASSSWLSALFGFRSWTELIITFLVVGLIGSVLGFVCFGIGKLIFK